MARARRKEGMDHRAPTALVIGASGGIGRAVAARLNAAGATVVGLSRQAGDFDLADPASLDHRLARLEGLYDLVFIATGALEPGGHRPEKALSQLGAEALARHFAVNATGPAMVLKHAPRLLPRDRPARLAALSARVGSIGDNRLGGWHGYRAAKAALNQLVHGAAIQLARSHPQAICVALHPGTVATKLTAVHGKGHRRSPPEHAAIDLLAVLDRLSPPDSGGFFDYAGRPVPW